MTIWLRLKRQGSVRHVLGRGLWGLTLLIVGFAILSPLAEAMASEQDFVVLQKKLAADGFPPQKLAR
ncbi:MAG TPA: hypothetical protein DEO88_12270, partial [Syntrophobacteraceae bacterium]|nr:hypothetical protein [Syntrophobacteraceae bacterium]